MATPTYHCEYAYLGGPAATPDVTITVADGVIVGMTSSPQGPSSTGAASADVPQPGARPEHAAVIELPGLTLPGFANTHSHVFHRAIRGHTQSGAADFWQWRKVMYRAAAALDPDSLYELARATYAEMLLAGITSVGEFFYLHHDPAGERYANPNEMGLAVVRAASDAGIRITLLDTCYLQAGVDGAPPDGAQVRFTDGTWQQWAERVDALTGEIANYPLVRVGAAIHSVRAVPREAMRPIAEFCAERSLPLHAHLSEQPAENEACRAVHGCTPTELLAAEGVLGPSFTAVHATHLTDRDIDLLGSARSFISMCPTTERDLADGVGPAIRLAAAGSPLVLGSDGHMMIDLLEEGRAVELNERLVTGQRGHLTASQIARALTVDGQRSIGWYDGPADETGSGAGGAGVADRHRQPGSGGRPTGDAARPTEGLAAGQPADLVTIRLDSVRTAGARSGDVLAHALFSATASDVDSVIVSGKQLVSGGDFLASDPAPALEQAIAALLASFGDNPR